MRLVHAGGLALALGLEQDQGGGDRDVQGLGHAHHRDDDLCVDGGQCLGTDPELFRAHDDSSGPGVVGLAEVDGAVGKMRGIELEAGCAQLGQAADCLAVADQLDPALGPLGGVVQGRDAAGRWHGVGAHHADGIAGTQDGSDVMRLVNPLHEDGQVDLATGGNGLNAGFAFGRHRGMVLPMSFVHRILAGLVVLLASIQASADEPDFEAFTSLIGQTLAAAGPGAYIGDRSELYRYTPDGWEIQMMTVWAETRWHLLALRLHHPDRIEEEDGEFHQRYRRLLAAIDRDRVPDLVLPVLIDVPPPSYLPAVPDELRGRSFRMDGFWYQARWINAGGVDMDASWALRSYELVAEPD